MANHWKNHDRIIKEQFEIAEQDALALVDSDSINEISVVEPSNETIDLVDSDDDDDDDAFMAKIDKFLNTKYTKRSNDQKSVLDDSNGSSDPSESDESSNDDTDEAPEDEVEDDNDCNCNCCQDEVENSDGSNSFDVFDAILGSLMVLIIILFGLGFQRAYQNQEVQKLKVEVKKLSEKMLFSQHFIEDGIRNFDVYDGFVDNFGHFGDDFDNDALIAFKKAKEVLKYDYVKYGTFESELDVKLMKMYIKHVADEKMTDLLPLKRYYVKEDGKIEEELTKEQTFMRLALIGKCSRCSDSEDLGFVKDFEAEECLSICNDLMTKASMI